MVQRVRREERLTPNNQTIKAMEEITQFSFETRKQSIINHFSLDIEEEDSFFDFITHLGYDENSDDETIINLHDMWEKQPNNG